MAITDESNGMVMPVSPMNGNGGFGFGGDWGWIILLLLFAGGGWGNGFGGGFNNALGYDFPWLINGQTAINNNTNNGFRDAMLNDGINGIRDGITGISTQLCNGFAGVEAGANARQIADMQTAFANQTAMTNGFSNVQAQLAQCCCDNRLATAQTQALVQSENCADRQALSDGIRDLITNQNAGVQRILDQMCSDKIDSKNEKIADLERQLTMANLAQSQTAQTAQILANNEAQTNALERYLAPNPIPAYVVQNPNCCSQGCGCGF